MIISKNINKQKHITGIVGQKYCFQSSCIFDSVFVKNEYQMSTLSLYTRANYCFSCLHCSQLYNWEFCTMGFTGSGTVLVNWLWYDADDKTVLLTVTSTITKNDLNHQNEQRYSLQCQPFLFKQTKQGLHLHSASKGNIALTKLLVLASISNKSHVV